MLGSKLFELSLDDFWTKCSIPTQTVKLVDPIFGQSNFNNFYSEIQVSNISFHALFSFLAQTCLTIVVLDEMKLNIFPFNFPSFSLIKHQHVMHQSSIHSSFQSTLVIKYTSRNIYIPTQS